MKYLVIAGFSMHNTFSKAIRPAFLVLLAAGIVIVMFGLWKTESAYSFNKDEFFALLDKVSSHETSDQAFVEETLGVKFTEATKQNEPAFAIYESAPSTIYPYVDYVLFYASETGSPNRVYIGLSKELRSSDPLRASDAIEKYGSAHQFATPATNGHKFGELSYYYYALQPKGAIHFAFHIPENKKIDLKGMPVEVVIIER